MVLKRQLTVLSGGHIRAVQSLHRLMKHALITLVALSSCFIGLCAQAQQTNAAREFTLTVAPPHRTIVQGGSRPVSVQIARRQKFKGAVNLTLVGMPAGVTGMFSKNPIAWRSSRLTLHVAPTVPIGSYKLIIRGSSIKTEEAFFNLTVASPLPPSVFAVDPAIKPDFESLQGLELGKPRLVTSMADEKGHKATFVENELIVSTVDDSHLAPLLKRWQGKVLTVINRWGATTPNPHVTYLIQVDPTKADITELPANLQRANPNVRGKLVFSNQEGLHLFAAAAKEAADGTTIGLNWVMQHDGIFLGGVSKEAPTGPLGTDNQPYNPNAFTWNFLKQSGQPGLGVTHAWQGLELAGKLQNKVKVAIIEDGGFAPNADFPPGFQAVSMISGQSEVNVPDPIPTAEKNFVFWHGTWVAEALAGVANNGFGAAGPAGAGPNADLILITQTLDHASVMEALLQAQIMGARIINMSFGSKESALATLGSAGAFEEITALLRSHGTLIFASAGNSGESFDDEDWHSPCQNEGVICVGGLAPDSRYRDPNSNFGSGDVGDDSTVDIYAPYSVLVGPDPSNPSNRAQWVNGTSFSSPYAAGVTALIWAANPALSADEVEDILFTNAAASPDPTVQSNRIVLADAAVGAALGNLAPQVTITAPQDGSGVASGAFNNIKLQALAIDFEDGNDCCTLTWSSDQDGPLGTGKNISATFFKPGPRKITVEAKDSSGSTSSASIHLVATDSPPTVIITKPHPGDVVYKGVSNIFAGQGSDFNEPLLIIPCAGLTWTSTNPGDPKLTGCHPNFTFASVGVRTLTLTGKDSQGATAQAKVTIMVTDLQTGAAPAVTIQQPLNDSLFLPKHTATLLGVAVGKQPLTYSWKFKTADSEVPVKIKQGPSSSILSLWIPSDYLPWHCGTSSGELWLYVTDGDGMTGSDHVSVGVLYGPC